jgi:hypothetical protein
VENPDLDDLEMDQVVEELAGMLEADKKQWSVTGWQTQSSWWNPLFNNPAAAAQNHPQAVRVMPPGVKVKKKKPSWWDDGERTKIRV